MTAYLDLDLFNQFNRRTRKSENVMKAMLKLMIRKIPNTKLQSCNQLDVFFKLVTLLEGRAYAWYSV